MRERKIKRAWKHLKRKKKNKHMGKAKQLIREGIDYGESPDLIHPERKQSLAGGSHPLSNNPAFPDFQAQAGSQNTNYSEMLASKRWQKLVKKAERYLGFQLSRQTLPRLGQAMVGAMNLMAQAEQGKEEELQKLAVEIVFELPEFSSFKEPFERGEFGLKPQITSAEEINLDGVKSTDDFESPEELNFDQPESGEESGAPEGVNAEQAEAAAEQRQSLQKKLNRRHLSNAFIQGSAISNNFAFELGGARLDQINPGLRKAYGILMAMSEIGYWLYPQSAVVQALQAQAKAGSTRVEMQAPGQDEEEVLPDDLWDAPPEEGATEKPQSTPQAQSQGEVRPVIIAQGIHLPVLIQEIIKGLTELASMHGLPQDEHERNAVMDKADLIDSEAWHMMLGPELWDRFMQAVDSQNEREITMHLYTKIQSMDDDEFNAFVKGLLAHDRGALNQLKQFAQEIKTELAGGEEGHGGYEDGEGGYQSESRRLIDGE